MAWAASPNADRSGNQFRANSSAGWGMGEMITLHLMPPCVEIKIYLQPGMADQRTRGAPKIPAVEVNPNIAANGSDHKQVELK